MIKGSLQSREAVVKKYSAILEERGARKHQAACTRVYHIHKQEVSGRRHYSTCEIYVCLDY